MAWIEDTTVLANMAMEAAAALLEVAAPLASEACEEVEPLEAAIPRPVGQTKLPPSLTSYRELELTLIRERGWRQILLPLLASSRELELTLIWEL